MILPVFTLTALLDWALFEGANAHPQPARSLDLRAHCLAGRKDQIAAINPPNCFPALGFEMPSSVPSSVTNWWCDHSTEYAFVGISYEVTACKLLILRKVFVG